MLEKEDLDSIKDLIATPMTEAMRAQKELFDEKLTSLGRSIDTVRKDQETQIKHCQKTTREMLDFKTGTSLRVQALEKDATKKDKRTWAVILAVVTLGMSVIVKWVFKL